MPVDTTLGAILAADVATVLTIDDVTELVNDSLAGAVAGTVDDTAGLVTLSGVDAAELFADSTASVEVYDRLGRMAVGALGNSSLALLLTFTSTP